MPKGKYLRNSNMKTGKYIRIKPNAVKGRFLVPRETRTCVCGCGQKFECRITSKQKYAKNGHGKINRIFIHFQTRTCICGCNRTFECRANSKHRFISGHNSAVRIITEETRERLRISKIGKNNPMFGKSHSKESIIKLIETKKRNGTLISKPETKRKQRIAMLKNIELNYGTPYPAYNKEACEFFKRFDIGNCTSGRYAVHGDGEYYIKELGYFVDYINFNLQLIIEVDEKHHFDINGDLIARDIQRQKEIQELFPHYAFMRIKEEDMADKIINNFEVSKL